MNYERAVADVDATRTGQQALADALANPRLTVRQRVALERRQTVGAALAQARAQYVPLVPTSEPINLAAAQWKDRYAHELERIAHADAQLAASPTGRRRQAILDRRRAAETTAFGADVAYRLVNSDGGPDVHHLTAQEAVFYRTASPEERQQVAYLTHLRAAVDSGAHDQRFAEHASAREQEIRARLFPGQPAAAAATTGRAGRSQGAPSPDSKSDKNDKRSGRRRFGGRRVSPATLMSTMDRGAPTPGKQQSSKPIGLLPDDVST